MRSLDEDREFSRRSRELAGVKGKYKQLMDRCEMLERELAAATHLAKKMQTFKIEPKKSSGSSEATAFMVASDWHIEETVKADEVNGLNTYNLTISEQRARDFFRNGLRLYQVCSKDVRINHIVLALLGDFVSSNIHDELMEICSLRPVDAVWRAQQWLASGIEFLLKHTDCNIIVPCAGGNHSRITKKMRHATEQGNSLEYIMYCNLALHFAHSRRVKFIIGSGYHTYLMVYDQTVRLHHGHAIRYQGGVGGLTIPANKAIAQWNKAKHADLDIFGHWHSFFDAGNFICNGSLIGFNAFAVSIKASFEKPKQAFFLLDRKRGKTIVAPILTNGGGK